MYNGDCIPIKDIKPGLKNINVIFIVLDVGTATVTKENREVRNFKVADATASINVSIWDEPGKLIAPGDIIKVTKGYASIWRHCLTLYSGKNGEVIKFGEFCMTFNEQINMSEPKRQEQPQQQPIGIGVSPQQILPTGAPPLAQLPVNNNGNTNMQRIVSNVANMQIKPTTTASNVSGGIPTTTVGVAPTPQQQQQQQPPVRASSRGGRSSATRANNPKLERR